MKTTEKLKIETLTKEMCVRNRQVLFFSYSLECTLVLKQRIVHEKKRNEMRGAFAFMTSVEFRMKRMQLREKTSISL